MSSYKSMGKTARSHSIHVAMERDYDRKKRLEKQEIKYEKEYDVLQRRLTLRVKSEHHSGNNNNNNQTTPSITLDEFMQREKIKQENIIKAKQLANERIRRT
jgi:hypothetical protein